jgi:hypothetical protein
MRISRRPDVHTSPKGHTYVHADPLLRELLALSDDATFRRINLISLGITSKSSIEE